ncbi:MAG: PEP-CTERM sorting domain-containing protein [Caulobacteraceae bacterium]|nr:PEP-CTERM sorting domain-containing protein [Caulobacteraceae bacterium]
MKYATIVGFAGAVCLGLVPVAASATNIQLGINGNAQASLSSIDFGQYPNGPPYTPAPGYGTFEVSLASGIFLANGVTTGEFGMIQSLNGPAGPLTLPSAFITFDTGGSNLQLWATKLDAGNHGFYTLFDTPLGAVGSIDVQGYVLDTTTDKKLGDFNMVASATFAGETVAELLASPTPIDTPFSATFTFTAVPEPATWVMMLVGVGAMGFSLRSGRRTRSLA